MKVLWLCNVMLPKIAEHLGIRATVFGGWLNLLSDELAKNDGIELLVCFLFAPRVKRSLEKAK